MAAPSTELQVGERTVRISNPDRVYFPDRGETKLDLVNYYLSVGPGIVRALRERPCMLHRYPEGVAGEKIYQKRLPKGAPEWVETVEVSFPSGRTADELCVTELAAVAWAVQMSTVEFHPWHTRRGAVERPDELRIDLDPGPAAGFAEAKLAAEVVHEVLDELGAVGWPKTSGSKGVHVYVRIEPRFGFREVRRAALAFAREVGRRAPSLVTTNWWKEERPDGAIFIDYNQNAKDRTIAAAYSVRGLPHGPVSAPVTWDELPNVEMADFDISTMPARFAEVGDLHAGMDDAVWDIEPLLDWADRDELAGVGDAPYPPNYPKQEGEPPRVQPSRMNKANWNTDDPNAVEPQQLD
ncbi:MAG TPA: non-homologous end-joining DNA ligase [Jatrophihabitantaceae bacterium]|jgi:DNA ligase D